MSEVAVDLANDLVRRVDWDPRAWVAPQQHLLDTDEAVDCGEAKLSEADASHDAAEMSVTFPDADYGPMFDCYLDDLFVVSRERDRARLEVVIPLVLHLIGQPVEEGWPSPCPGTLLSQCRSS